MMIRSKESLSHGLERWMGSTPVSSLLLLNPQADIFMADDDGYRLAVAGGTTAALVLPGSANAIGKKLRTGWDVEG